LSVAFNIGVFKGPPTFSIILCWFGFPASTGAAAGAATGGAAAAGAYAGSLSHSMTSSL